MNEVHGFAEIHLDVVAGVAVAAGAWVGAWLARGVRPRPGETVAFAGALVTLLAVLNGPLHALSDRYLFSAHMVQHLALTLAVPPLLLVGTPAFMVDGLLQRRTPARLARLSPPRQLELLAKDASRPNARAKLLYGLALQRLGRRLSAQREYDEAARLAPNDPETQVAAALSRFDKSRPSAAFSRLGPLTRRYPRAATVRFHLGLMLLWIARAQPGALAEGRRQLRLAQKEQPRSPLAREAKRLLAGLEGV